MSGYAHPELLVETSWLQEHLQDPDLRIYDCTTYLDPDPEKVYRVRSGRPTYDEGHIPGAAFVELQAELSDANSPFRFTIPSAEQFAAAIGAKGLGDDCRVVLYSAGTMWWATRMWWLLRVFGFDNAMVLNGGFQKWVAEERAVSTEPTAHAPATFTPRPRPHLVADKQSVLAAIQDDDAVVVNALTRRQHSGGSGVQYGRPGRIAGSVCVPAMETINLEKNVFLSADTLRDTFAKEGVSLEKRVVTYCGGGIAASATAFALIMLGHENVTLYDNSLSEWAQDPNLPMEQD